MRGSYKKRYNKGDYGHLIPIIPIALVLALLPITVVAKLLQYDTSGLFWYGMDSFPILDIFTYSKAFILISAASIAVIVLFCNQFVTKRPIAHKTYIPAYLYASLAILSTLFSISVYYSIRGYIDHLEGIFVLLSYVVVFIYVAEQITEHRQIQFLIWLWTGTICVLTLIGLTQFFGNDFYRTEFGINMVVPASLKPMIDSIDFTLYADNLIYQSLFHYNYVSFYSAVVFPFFFALILGDGNRKHRIIYTIVCAMALFNLIGSQGRNGFIGLAVGVFFVLLMYGRKYILSKYTLISVLLIIIVSSIVLVTTESTIEYKFKRSIETSINKLDYPLNEIRTVGNTIYVDHDDYQFNTLIGTSTEGNLTYTFTDANNEMYTIYANGNSIELFDTDGNAFHETVPMTMQTYKGMDVLTMKIEGHDWHFVTIDGKTLNLNDQGRAVPIAQPDSWLFEGRERMGSARGYIWSRSFPIIAANPLLGTGPDTFVIAFPQNDYVGKFNAYSGRTPIVDKPHNIFLGYAINTGLLSLIAILVIIFMALRRSVQSAKTTIASQPLHKAYSIACLGGIIGYLVAGQFNDTSLHVTPVFWILIGLAFALNKMAISSSK